MQFTQITFAAMAIIGAALGYFLFQREKKYSHPGVGTVLAALWIVQVVVVTIGLSLVQWLGQESIKPGDLHGLPTAFWVVYTVWTGQALTYITLAKVYVMKNRDPFSPY
ncbi:MAG TPA: hypothetical protein PLC15_07295 [Candidatus Obscuribacter sp.]|nr:hypothetical protein [Candidatus Obscuribacter sp.]MBL8085053.1 hypothetical protein [Candidatus Obscuribacter sp.]HMY55290.1 hypothetical protein [Candidatus Obscuribacter sp.]HNA73788.1 hypothetical protein [Candidatus Obscuribacter sp.]HNB15169.1 hypothetical protein [Candidatus Obscuribacter sp.]